MRRKASVQRWRAALAWFSLAAIVGVAGVLWLAGDRWWLTVPLLYGPRWVVGAALVGMVPLLLAVPRHGALLLAMACATLWFGVLGASPGLGRFFGGSDGLSLRVVTFNIRAGNDQDPAIGHWLADVDADIAVLTECRAERGAVIAEIARRNLRTASGICLLSRLKIDSLAARDPREFWREYGSGAIVRASVYHPIAGPLHIGMVHLATPRHVLDHFFDLSNIPTLGDTVGANIALRDRESAAARAWIGDPASIDLVAGDFNLPVESAIFRRHWGDFTNAFWQAGWGLGRTKYTRLIGVRIDHILLGDRLHARRSWVGPALGSDHRPVITELRIRN